MSNLPARALTALFSLVLLASACAGNSGVDTAGVASLEQAAGAATPDEPNAELSADEAALAFSACIREQGIDFPDVGVDADGVPQLRDAFQAADVDPRSEEFQAAQQACRGILDGVGFGGRGGRAALADNPELQDALVAFSDCIREQGFYVGDIELGGGPGQGGGNGTAPGNGDGPPQRGQGTAQGNFDPNSRFAAALGLDPEDPDVAAALEECSPIMDAAFAEAGVVRPGG